MSFDRQFFSLSLSFSVALEFRTFLTCPDLSSIPRLVPADHVLYDLFNSFVYGISSVRYFGSWSACIPLSCFCLYVCLDFAVISCQSLHIFHLHPVTIKLSLPYPLSRWCNRFILLFLTRVYFFVTNRPPPPTERPRDIRKSSPQPRPSIYCRRGSVFPLTPTER